MKKYLKKLPLFMTLLFLLVVSCSKTEEHNTEPYTGFYNFKSLYTNDLLLKIASKNESVSYYGTTNGDHIDLLMSLYKDNATGRRTIYKTNSTADTAIIYNFDKPEFGGILFIKRSSNILVQEFEFQSDNKTIKPTLYLTTIPVSLNRFSPSNIASSEDDSKFMDKEIDETGAWFMTAGMSEIIKSIEESISNFKETRKELLDDLYKMPETIRNFIRNKFNKNPLPIQEPISNDPAPNSDPIEPLPSHPFVDCNNVTNGTAYIDGWCNKCVAGNTGVPPCGPAIDCSGTVGGNAYKDDCNKCVEGNTGNIACVVTKDCNGVIDGSAYIDDCNICVGGNTGKTECVDQTEAYLLSAIGKYTVNGWVGNGPNSRLYCELKTGGVATYSIYDDSSWTDGTSWNATWTIQKQNDKYYYSESGWWNGMPNIKIDAPLSLPVNTFNYHHDTTYTK